MPDDEGSHRHHPEGTRHPVCTYQPFRAPRAPTVIPSRVEESVWYGPSDHGRGKQRPYGSVGAGTLWVKQRPYV